MPTGYQNFSTISRDWPLYSMHEQSSGISDCWSAHAFHFNLIFSFRLPIIPLDLIFTNHLKNLHRMELVPKPFLQTVQGNWNSIATSIFTTNHQFCLLNIYSQPDCDTPSQTSSLPFGSSSVWQTNAKSSAYSSSSGHPDLISVDTDPNTIIDNKELNTGSWCNPT